MATLVYRAIYAVFFSVACAVISSEAFATSNIGLVYQGRITKPDGTALTDSSVQFLIQVYGNSTLLGNGSAGSDRCLLYQETQTLDMSSSDGVFSLTIGQGSSPTFGSGVSSLVTVFRNPQTSSPAASEAIGAISCSSGQTKYLSSAWDNNREIAVTITSGSTVLNLASLPVQAVPYAEQALQVGGYSSDYLMRVQSSRPGAANSFTANQFDFLLNLGINTVTPGVPSTYQATNLLAVDPTATQQVATKHYVDTQIATVAPTASGVTAGSYGSATQIPVITVDAYGRITSATTATISGVSPTGSTLNDGQIWIGNSSNVATPVATSGDVSLANTGAFTVQKIQGVAVAATAPTSNQILQYNGSQWIPTTLSTGGTTISGGTSKVLGMFNATGDNMINSSITDNGTSGVDFSHSKITFNGSLFAKTIGESVFIGAGSGSGSGDYNTAVGNLALPNSSGLYNTAVGDVAMQSNTTGNYNSAFGLDSLRDNTSGSENTAFGSQSLWQNSTGNYNTAVGADALENSTGSSNTAVGHFAAIQISAGDGNLVLGNGAGPTVPGTYNNKLYIHNSQSDTPLIGGDFSAGYVQVNNQIEIPLSSTTPTPNTGYGRIYAKSDGNLYFQNATTETQLNVGSGGSISGTYKNIPMFNSAGTGLTASAITDNGTSGVNFSNSRIQLGGSLFMFNRGTENTFLGVSAGNTSFTTSSAVDNTAIGYQALPALTSGASNTAVGAGAGYSLTTGTSSVFVGVDAGSTITSGTENTVVGVYAAMNGNFDNVTALGSQALRSSTTGGNNTAVGQATLNGVTTGSYNTAIGVEAGSGFHGGNVNNSTAVGYQALYYAAGGNNNTAVGYEALSATVTGANNTAIGWGAGGDAAVATSSSNSVFIGYNANPSTSGTYNNRLFINNSKSDTPLIGGDFSAGYVQVNKQIELPLSATTPTPNTGYGRVYAKADGNLYFKNGTSEFWLNSQAGGGTYSLGQIPVYNGSGLAGVSCSSGQVLAWNVTTGFGCSDVTATQLQGRSIASTAPTTGQLLQYNGSAWVPVSGLEISGGAIYTDTQNNADGVVNIDFTTGNVQTSANTTKNAAFNLCGLKDGGSYSLVLTGQPINSTPTFAVYSDSACSSAITNFDSGGVTLTTTTATSIITLIRAGNTVYAMWATGFTH